MRELDEQPESDQFGFGEAFDCLTRLRLWEPKKLLYHYTDADGVLGIVRSGELRASDVLYVNDSSELEYAREVMWCEIRMLDTDQPVRRFIGEVRNSWELPADL